MKKLRELRRKWKIPAEILANMVGVSRMTLYRWEEGKGKPHPNHLEKLEKIIRRYEGNNFKFFLDKRDGPE